MSGAGDSEGTFGGNGSVHWKVDVNHVKQVTNTPRPGGHRHEGHCGTPPNGVFTVTLLSPRDDTAREALAKDLEDAAERLRGGYPDVDLRFPIEPNRHRQVVVNWPTADETFTPTIV